MRSRNVRTRYGAGVVLGGNVGGVFVDVIRERVLGNGFPFIIELVLQCVLFRVVGSGNGIAKGELVSGVTPWRRLQVEAGGGDTLRAS